MNDEYTSEEKDLLLKIAREAITRAATGEDPRPPDWQTMPPALQANRACFVTLHNQEGDLRGCTGTLVARQPLAIEVSRVAVQTAFHDPRFYPVAAEELDGLVIEVSILTPPEKLEFENPKDIPHLLEPHVDGVILLVGGRRATFLPQVWERVPDPEQFLDLLCRKMGLSPGAWRTSPVEVYTYRTIIMEEQSAPV